jgi:hypothetical protein
VFCLTVARQIFDRPSDRCQSICASWVPGCSFIESFGTGSKIAAQKSFGKRFQMKNLRRKDEAQAVEKKDAKGQWSALVTPFSAGKIAPTPAFCSAIRPCSADQGGGAGG